MVITTFLLIIPIIILILGAFLVFAINIGLWGIKWEILGGWLSAMLITIKTPAAFIEFLWWLWACNKNNDPCDCSYFDAFAYWKYHYLVFWRSANLVKAPPRLEINFSSINRGISVAIYDVVAAVVDVDTLVLVVTVGIEKLEVNVPLPTAVDTGSDLDVKTTETETIGRKSNASLLLFYFPDMNS